MFNRKQIDYVNVEAPAELGHPGDSFDLPYTVTTDDARVESYDYGGDVPVPYKYQSNEAFKDYQAMMPDSQGVYGLEFVNASALIPSNDQVSRVPAAGSQDLAEAMDTPYFAPGTNRLIHSDGPVRSEGSRFDGDVATIGRDLPGVSGPVSGDGSSGYSAALAASYAAAQFQQYSQEAATQALVASV